MQISIGKIAIVWLTVVRSVSCIPKGCIIIEGIHDLAITVCFIVVRVAIKHRFIWQRLQVLISLEDIGSCVSLLNIKHISHEVRADQRRHCADQVLCLS